MRDFLDNLLDEEEIRKNPAKAFAAYTALKFKQLDEKNEKQDEETNHVESDIKDLKSRVQSLEDLKLTREEYTLFLRDYDRFKTKVNLIVVGGTIILNFLIWIFREFIKFELIN